MLTTLILICILFLTLTSSPMMFALFLSLLSLILSMSVYSSMHSVFISSSLVISFSSGLMILFTYCALVTNYKEKSNFSINKMILPSLIIPMCFLMPSMKPLTQMPSMVNFTQNSNSILMIMIFLMITMISLNQSFFSLSKNLMKSY